MNVHHALPTGTAMESPNRLNHSISRLQLITASVLVPAQLFLFNVTTIVAGNQQYLSSPFRDLILLSILPFLVIALGVYVIARSLITKDQLVAVWYVLPLLFLCLWIQSQLLVWDYGGLTGGAIDWKGYGWRVYLEAAIWLISITLVVLFRNRIANKLFRFAAAILVLQAAVSLYSVAMLLASHEPVIEDDHTIDSLANFSKDSNVIHLVIDGFQSDVFEELLGMDNFETRYKNELQGFTFFPENMSVFPYTQFSIPTYLSSRVYKNNQQKEAFIDGVLSDRTIISVAKSKGYTVDLLVNGSYFARRHAEIPHDRIVDIDELTLGKGFLRDIALVWDISLFRSVPHFLKPYIYNDQEWLLSRLVLDDTRHGFSYFLHTDFLNKFASAITASEIAPTYKLIHVKNTHRPMIVGPRCDFAGTVLPDTRVTLAVQSACTMNTVFNFLDGLKKAGVYHDSMIVIHSDHGGWVPTLRDGFRIPKGEGRAQDDAVAFASALLMIKPPGEKGPLESSGSLTSLIDIPDTISNAMEWDADFSHMSVFSIDQESTRSRTFMYYPWHQDEWENDFTLPIIEYTVQGSHFEVEWKESGVYTSKEGLRLE
jgi:hypothetical protein